MSSQDRRPRDQPAPFRGEFSFVNKDAGNIDSKDHNAAVSWHVLNRYERWKRQEQARKLRASANVPIGLRSPRAPPEQQQSQPQPPPQPLAPRSNPASQPPSPPNRRRPEGRRQPLQPSGRRTRHDVPNQKTRTTEAAASWPGSAGLPLDFDPWTADVPWPYTYSGFGSSQNSSSGLPTSAMSTPSTQSGLVDEDVTPFYPHFDPTGMSRESFSLAGTPLARRLMSFAHEVFVPQCWPKEAGRTHRSYEVMKSWEDVALIDQDYCYATAYLSVLAAAMAALTDDDDLTYQSRYFQGQAMTELRRRVAGPGPQDLTTLKAVLRLFSAETLVDNTSVARVHLKMLRNLVNAAGGAILMDPWYREDLLSCDCYFALKYGTRPLFPAQEWTPGPLSQAWKVRLLAAGISHSLAVAMDSVIEHPVLKTVISDLRELFAAHEYTQTHDLLSDDQLLRWLQLRKFDCISRLADHIVNLTIYPHLFHHPLTQCYTAVALALLTNMVLGSPEPVRFGIKLLNELRRKLGEAEAEAEEEMGGGHRYGRLRLWALYVGSLAEQVHPMGPEREGWFNGKYLTQANGLSLTDWDGRVTLLRQFLFSMELHREIESGPRHRTFDVRQGLYSASGCSWRAPIHDTNFAVNPVDTVDTMHSSATEPGDRVSGMRWAHGDGQAQ